MSISELFIRRPVATALIWLGVAIFGVLAYFNLPVSALPNVDFPTISVTASLPGASPETMASSVATPLEREFTTIAGLDSMSSSSAQGNTRITLQFALDRNLDAAAQDVQSAISTAANRLPSNMPSPPTLRKVNPADMPVLYLALNSSLLPMSTVHEYGDTYLAQRISMISGVAQVLIFGPQKYAVRVQVDPQALASRGLGLDEVAQAVQGANVNLPSGTLQGAHQAFNIQPTGQLLDAASYRQAIVAYRGGNPVYLHEVGRVIDGVEQDKVAAWYRETRSLVLAIQRQPGTNTIEVVDAIKNVMSSLQDQLPASLNINVLYDRSATIRESVEDVKFTLALAVALVVMVVFLFLRNISATLITSLALPCSIMGTFAAMKQLGFSLDNLSLMALTLSVGFVVDDAIVMLENIVRHMEQGKSHMQAALEGAREIGFTVLSMTISLVAVFLPVLFMGGILGRLLNEFAVTIGVAILVSGAVSLTLTPMLCSRFLHPPKEEEEGRLYRVSEAFFDGMLQAYEWCLRHVLNHRRITMLVLLAMTAGTLYMFDIMPKGFIPSEDQSQIFGFTEASQGISYDSMSEHQQAVARIVAQEPAVVDFMSAIGPSGVNLASNSGRVFMHLKPRDERPRVDDVITRLRGKLAQVPGIQVYLQNPPPIMIGGTIAKSQYLFTLQSPNTEELYKYAPILEAKLRDVPGFIDVNSDLQIMSPEVDLTIDRDKASTLGVSAQRIEDTLYYAYGSRQISTIYAPTNQYQVILELLPEYQRTPSLMQLLYVRSNGNQMVPLEEVTKSRIGVGPMLVNHSGQLPSVTIAFNLIPGVSMSDAVESVNRLARNVLPATISTNFEGAAQAFQSSLKGMLVLLIMAIMVIYLVLGILYESFIHPLTILSGLPTAAFGALITLHLFGHDLNLYAFVGIIMLVGIMKKNAIMMIDFAIEAQRKDPNKSPKDAIYEGCLIRFRPIMMTTMAALMGTLPIALGLGAGAESRRPLGLAVVGGLMFSQMLTLFVTPVFYTYMESFQARWAARRARSKRAHPAVS